MTDPNASQRADWNDDSGRRWVAEADRRDRVLAPALDEVLRGANPQPGEKVLDVGCGCGALTLAAAARVGDGSVTGVDISHTMLAVARQRAAGSESVTFIEADAQACAFESVFDVVISRFGTMFFADPVAAFGNIRGAVGDGGRLCLATWQEPTANEWIAMPRAVLLDYTDAPPEEVSGPGPGPGMFAQSEPAAVRTVLSDAGWHDVRVDRREVELAFGDSAADAADYLADAGPGRRLLETINPECRADALAALTETLQSYRRDGAVRLKAGINIIEARAS